MHRIDSHISITQAFGKFSGKQYVRQFALVVGFALIVGLFAVQICCVDFPSCMSQTREIDYPTGRRFLGKNSHWHDVTNRGMWCTFSVSSSKLVRRKWPRWLTPSCISKPSAVRDRGQRITPALLISKCSSFRSRWKLQGFDSHSYICRWNRTLLTWLQSFE